MAERRVAKIVRQRHIENFGTTTADASFLASGVGMDRCIDAVVATVDAVGPGGEVTVPGWRVRDLFGLKRAPEFDDWLLRAGLADAGFRLAGNTGLLPDFELGS